MNNVHGKLQYLFDRGTKQELSSVRNWAESAERYRGAQTAQQSIQYACEERPYSCSKGRVFCNVTVSLYARFTNMNWGLMRACSICSFACSILFYLMLLCLANDKERAPRFVEQHRVSINDKASIAVWLLLVFRDCCCFVHCPTMPRVSGSRIKLHGEDKRRLSERSVRLKYYGYNRSEGFARTRSVNRNKTSLTTNNWA